MKRKAKLVPHVRVAESAVVLMLAAFVLGMTAYAAHIGQITSAIYDQANKIAQADSATPAQVHSFEACRNTVGSKILLMYPETCVTKDGARFTNAGHVLELASGKVTLMVPSGFKVATGPTVHAADARVSCYKSVMSTADCLDSIILILENESYADTDQFQVSVSVYPKDKSLSLRDWFDGSARNGLGLGSETNSTIKDIVIDGQQAIEYNALYPDEDRVSFAVAKGEIGVVVHSNTFKGNYYSFKNANNTDYRAYLPAIKSLAESIHFN